MLNIRRLLALSIPSAEAICSTNIDGIGLGVADRLTTKLPYKFTQLLRCPIVTRGGRSKASPSPCYVTLVRSVPARLLQPFEQGRIGWTIYLQQAKGAFFGAEE